MTEKDKFPKRGNKPAGGKPPRKAEAPAAAGEEKQGERISKILARAGVASRRDAERMILDGRVKVNGKLLDTPAHNVTLEDKIEVDGEEIRGIERTRLWIYHKPAGLVTTNSDPEGRPTVFDNLPAELPRVISIGRLDINTEGLLLLTNDGGLARVLELPATGWLRRYRVRAHGKIEQADLDKLKDGIAVDGVLYGAIDATLDRVQGSNVWITMGLREGKNREIKNVLGALGLEVGRLIRISYGPFQLGEIAEGAVMEVRGRTLRDQLGPRLIEEAGANFDAPIYNDKQAESEAPKSGGNWKPEPGKRAEPGKRRPDKLDRGERAERGRDRLDTKRKGDDEKPFKDIVTRNRAANVWMAPGARPLGPKAKKKAEDKAKEDARRDARRDGRRASAADGDAPRARGPAGGRGKPFAKPAGKPANRGPRKPREAGAEDTGEARRFDGPKRPRGEGRPASGEGRPEGGKRFDGPKREGAAPRGERPAGEKRGGRPEGGKRPGGDRPRSGGSREGGPGRGPKGNADRRR
ncbi:pseudouridine synthase [Martelella mediterranea]|uniref:Pseudouridine synthase n=1 Tax=Martelella mediterranea DSM 17316 TaxID=1122214 RepID=A0A1U9Z622_9HYPH|nr:pseudouridine synthase [Martelella mediterranea]AQZ53165.1 Ribosomal large subunit pseudouridine synthase B [Martelella mediterranea DSM 17316]